MTKSKWRYLEEAVWTALETNFLPTGAGEMIGGIKVASILATDYGIWAKRAEVVVSKSKKLNDKEKLDLCFEIKAALAKKDIRTILTMYIKYRSSDVLDQSPFL